MQNPQWKALHLPVRPMLPDRHSVHPDGRRSFRFTCNSKPGNTKQEVSAGNIRNLNIRFTPDKKLKEVIQKAGFVYSETMVEGCIRRCGYSQLWTRIFAVADTNIRSYRSRIFAVAVTNIRIINLL
ncbi:MAG: hypothetical protein LBB62_07690 [Proteiniphilum sp.]|nr:hypothetical protein [Proteiniphilum sp.]